MRQHVLLRTVFVVVLASEALVAQEWGVAVAASAVATSVSARDEFAGGAVVPLIVERSSYNVGLVVRHEMSRRLRLQPELWLFDRGGEGLRKRYLELPVLLQFVPFAVEGRVRPVLTLGLQGGALLKCRWETTTRGACSDTARSPRDYRTKPYDLAWAGGLGVETTIGRRRVGADLRFSHSLVDVGYDAYWRHSNVSVSLIGSVRR